MIIVYRMGSTIDVQDLEGNVYFVVFLVYLLF